MKITVLNANYTIHKLDPADIVPPELFKSEFYWIGKSDDELSIVCASEIEINTKDSNKDWVCLKADDVLDLSVVGVLARLTKILAEAFISIFAVSTYNTDYIFVKKNKLQTAITALQKAGFIVTNNYKIE